MHRSLKKHCQVLNQAAVPIIQAKHPCVDFPKRLILYSYRCCIPRVSPPPIITYELVFLYPVSGRKVDLRKETVNPGDAGRKYITGFNYLITPAQHQAKQNVWKLLPLQLGCQRSLCFFFYSREGESKESGSKPSTCLLLSIFMSIKVQKSTFCQC